MKCCGPFYLRSEPMPLKKYITKKLGISLLGSSDHQHQGDAELGHSGKLFQKTCTIGNYYLLTQLLLLLATYN